MKMKFLLTWVLLITSLAAINAQSDSLSVSARTAPDFKLENIDRENVALNDFIGTGPILLCFWASCCRSAVAQLEAFSDIYEKYKENGFILLAVATDDEKTVAKVKPFVKSKKYKFPVMYDMDNSVARIYYAYDMPFSVLINKSGNIVYSRLGYMKGDEIELEKKIVNLLSK